MNEGGSSETAGLAATVRAFAGQAFGLVRRRSECCAARRVPCAGRVGALTLVMVPLEVVRHAAHSDEPELDAPRALELREARLGLTAVERRAVEELVTGASGETAAFVASRAAALAGDESAAVRRRSLAKMLAVQEALSSQLTALLAAAVGRKDEPAVKLLDRALNGAVSRFTKLTEELRAEMTGGRRALVQVGVAQHVTISEER